MTSISETFTLLHIKIMEKQKTEAFANSISAMENELW